MSKCHQAAAGSISRKSGSNNENIGMWLIGVSSMSSACRKWRGVGNERSVKIMLMAAA
jgi:hypothetical protein